MHIAGLKGSGVGVAVGVAVGTAQVFPPAGPVHGHPAGQSVLVLHESPQERGGNVGEGVGVRVGAVVAVGTPVGGASQVPLVEQTGQATTH